MGERVGSVGEDVGTVGDLTLRTRKQPVATLFGKKGSNVKKRSKSRMAIEGRMAPNSRLLIIGDYHRNE